MRVTHWSGQDVLSPKGSSLSIKNYNLGIYALMSSPISKYALPINFIVQLSRRYLSREPYLFPYILERDSIDLGR